MKSNIKILIVDDDKSSATMIGEIVKRMGFKSVIVNKAADGLNVAKLQTVHAAILDVMLPKMSGVDLACELRDTKFAESPIVLVSGVFKDKGFAADAMKKSLAIDFLFKPFTAEDLIATLTRVLADQMITEKWSLQALLMRKLTSARERSKVIEHLEPISGHDFPFVLSLLMESGLSGHLNLVSDTGEIFGITLSRGTIAEVDSSDSQSTGILNLISNGFLAQEDWDAFEKNSRRKFPLERLVTEGLVSPHAVGVAKHEQILAEFRAICASSGMQINFVTQDDTDEPPKHAVSMKQLLRIFGTAMEEFFPESHLREFYAPVVATPMHLTRPSNEISSLWSTEMFSLLDGLRSTLEAGGTLQDVLNKYPTHSAEVYSCLHYLVLSRSVIFDDVNLAKSLNNTLERYRDLYAQINGKPADLVFEYFGADARPVPSVVEKIYADYVRSNSPDLLPADAPAELIDLARKCFDLVQAARTVMTSEVQRTALFESRKEEGTQRQKKANDLINQGLDVLRKGNFEQAAATLKQAEQLHPSGLQLMIQTWAEVKAGLLSTKPMLVERAKKLDLVTADEKKSAYFHMAIGMVKQAQGDPSAVQSFERVLEIDSGFGAARREMNASRGTKEKKMDLLNGDITGIVSQLFRRKAE